MYELENLNCPNDVSVSESWQYDTTLSKFWASRLIFFGICDSDFYFVQISTTCPLRIFLICIF